MERSKLQQRNYTLDLKARLGKTQVVTNTTPINQQVSLSTPFCVHHKYVLPLGETPGKVGRVTGTTKSIWLLSRCLFKFRDLFWHGTMLSAYRQANCMNCYCILQGIFPFT